MLATFFKLDENKTDVRTEVLAGITTFLTMAYIIFVNPLILGDAGMDKGAVFVATCLAAAGATLLMGLYANYPIALAPGMGLNAYFAYGVVLGMGVSWQVALGAVFVSGFLFLVLTVTRVREWIINSIPRALKLSISAGIGLFLAIIALKNAGLIVENKATIVGIGNLKSPTTILACLGFFVMVGLDAMRVRGAIMIAILAVTAIGIVFGFSPFNGVASMPPSLAPTFFQMDVAGALSLGLVAVVFAFLFVDLFDNAGTLIGLAHRAGFLDKEGKLPRIRQALVTDSVAAMGGAVLGTSTTTSYIESAAGIKEGGRTGLTAVVVALLFLLALFFAPLATTVPGYATAPALFFVACLMARGLAELDWEDVTEYAPGVVTAVAMPLTFSIAHGIAFGFISYAAIKIAAGRFQDVSPVVAVLAILFIVKFAIL
ncbi:MAG: NCS2 family permease, partial [Alphaproteobacteria bacterium]|nr:NCS2 family permease [Alphaproteobacteria bacterium]